MRAPQSHAPPTSMKTESFERAESERRGALRTGQRLSAFAAAGWQRTKHEMQAEVHHHQKVKDISGRYQPVCGLLNLAVIQRNASERTCSTPACEPARQSIEFRADQPAPPSTRVYLI